MTVDFYQLSALLLLAVYYAAYFIKMLLQRRKGIRTNQMGQGDRKSARTLHIEKLLSLSTVVAVLVQVASILLGTGRGRPGWSAVLGLIFTGAGTVFFLLAVWTMRDSWRAGIPAEGKPALVVRGIYRVSRNPAFLGFDLTYLGVLLLFPTPVQLLSAVWGVVMIHLQILEEERYLTGAFGAEYTSYRKQTGRYLLF